MSATGFKKCKQFLNNKYFYFIILLILALLSGAGFCFAANSGAYFYHGQNYGSESQFGHLQVITNIGLSVVGPYSWGNKLSDIEFSDGLRTLGKSYTNPDRTIKDYYGNYGNFFYNEFAPIIAADSYPNYFLHFIGEGMLSRKLYEYNLAQGLSERTSRLTAILTVVIAQQLNEVVEAAIVKHGDALADLVFNTAGVIAFSYEGFARIFSNDSVQLYFWPGQALVDVRDATLYNNSETYMLRTTLGSWTKAKFGLLFGIPSNGIGISVPVNQRDYLSAFLINQEPLVPEYPYKSITPVRARPYAEGGPETEMTLLKGQQPAFRFVWDRKGSLMTTLEFGYPKLSATLNVYPGVVDFGETQLGLFASVGSGSVVAFGLTATFSPIMPSFRFR